MKRAIVLLLLLLLLVGCSTYERVGDLYVTNINASESVSTGELTLSTPVYTSVDIPVSSMVFAGTDTPEWKPFPPANSVIAPLFADEALVADENELYFIVQVPHGYVEGSNVQFYMHYAYMSNTIGEDAKFGIDYAWANQEAAYGANTTVYRVLTSTNNDAYYHHWVGFPAITGTGMKIGSILVCRMFRNSSSADDTYGGYVALLEVDLVCQVDTLGSSQQTVK